MTRLLAGMAVSFIVLAPAAAQPDSDRCLEGLKGPVGSVLVEVSRIDADSGKNRESRRTRNRKSTYDQRGELVGQVFYKDGLPWTSHFYRSELDGSKQETVYGPGIASTFADIPREDEEGLRGPVRLRHVRTANAGANGFEEVCYAGHEAYRRTVVIRGLDGGAKEELRYDHNGDLVYRSTRDYDENGHVASRVDYDGTGRLLRRQRFTYDFDAQGNWIRRVADVTSPGDGSLELRVSEVTYRRISYYPPIGNFVEPSALSIPGSRITGRRPKVAGAGGRGAHSSVRRGAPVKRVKPGYPEAARKARIVGIVLIEVTVDEEGDVVMARRKAGHPLLADEALKAIWKWQFTPTTIGGAPVRTTAVIMFSFGSN